MNKILCILIASLFILLTVAGGSSPAALEEMPVKHLELQAKLLRVVVRLSTRRLEQMVVGVIYVEEAKSIAEEFATAMTKLTYNDRPIQVVFIASDTLDSIDESVNVLYVTPGNADLLETIYQLAAEKSLFSSSGIPDYVEQDKIALGFESHKNRPKLLLNLPVAKSTTFDFKNPRFLNLQRTGELILIK